jgi:hypothetical protein
MEILDGKGFCFQLYRVPSGKNCIPSPSNSKSLILTLYLEKWMLFEIAIHMHQRQYWDRRKEEKREGHLAGFHFVTRRTREQVTLLTYTYTSWCVLLYGTVRSIESYFLKALKCSRLELILNFIDSLFTLESYYASSLLRVNARQAIALSDL